QGVALLEDPQIVRRVAGLDRGQQTAEAGVNRRFQKRENHSRRFAGTDAAKDEEMPAKILDGPRHAVKREDDASPIELAWWRDFGPFPKHGLAPWEQRISGRAARTRHDDDVLRFVAVSLPMPASLPADPAACRLRPPAPTAVAVGRVAPTG